MGIGTVARMQVKRCAWMRGWSTATTCVHAWGARGGDRRSGRSFCRLGVGWHERRLCHNAHMSVRGMHACKSVYSLPIQHHPVCLAIAAVQSAQWRQGQDAVRDMVSHCHSGCGDGYWMQNNSRHGHMRSTLQPAHLVSWQTSRGKRTPCGT